MCDAITSVIIVCISQACVLFVRQIRMISFKRCEVQPSAIARACVFLPGLLPPPFSGCILPLWRSVVLRHYAAKWINRLLINFVEAFFKAFSA